METELTEADIRAFQNSIGITRFARVCVTIHNTFSAAWNILAWPFVKFFSFTPTLPPESRRGE